MRIDKASDKDAEELVKLRIAYLQEDLEEISEFDLQRLKET